MQQKLRATGRVVAAHNPRKALSPSLSDSTDEGALSTHLVSGCVRHVGRVTNYYYETSSYDDTSSSENREDYVPLAFEFINSNPRRCFGAPTYSKIPSGVWEEADKDESISLSNVPLEVLVDHNRIRRQCGPGTRDLHQTVVTSSKRSKYDDDDDSSTASDALPIMFERRRRTRQIGKVKPTTYEVFDAESPISLSDEEEAPLNAQLIHTLIKRLRNPSDEVSLEAFDFVDFSDENFQEELVPLQKIQTLLRERGNFLVADVRRDREIKDAVDSFPPEKAIAAKVKAIKSRQIRSSEPHSRLCRVVEEDIEKMEVFAELVGSLTDPNAEVSLRAFDAVDWSSKHLEPVLAPLREIRACMEAMEVLKGVPAEGKMGGELALETRIKRAVMALPSDEAMAATIRAVKSRAIPNSSSNGDAIRHLVARLREPGQVVPAIEFATLDWNDRNFSRVLAPLREIRACMEAMEVLKGVPAEGKMGGELALETRIKRAVMALPSDEAMAATIRAVKSRAIPNSSSNGDAIRHLVARLREPGQVVPAIEFATLDWNDRNFSRELASLQEIRACMEAMEVLKGVPAEGKMGGELALETRIKRAVMALPSDEAMAATIRAVKSRAIPNSSSNGDAIRHLVARLREPGQVVPAIEFATLEWNDRNFSRELASLQEIRACMEAMEVLKGVPAEGKMGGELALETRIKRAVMALPSDEAMAATIRAVKSRAIPNSSSNGDAIRHLVARLREPGQVVPAIEFATLEWNDRNFSRVLAPLREIRACMEAMEVLKGVPAEGKMGGELALETRIKRAVMALPSDEAMAATIRAVKSRAIPNSSSNGDAIRHLVARLREPGQVVPAIEFATLEWNDRNFSRELASLQEIRACMEAMEVLKGVPAEGKMGGELALETRIKRAVMALPSDEAMAATIRAVKSRAIPNSSSNGDAIRHLVARLREPGQVVPAIEFATLEWNDRNFSRELAPLQEIRACMEAMEALQHRVEERVMFCRWILNEKIKTATMLLPPEKAIAVKSQMLKMREMAPAVGRNSPSVKIARLSAAAWRKKKLSESILTSSPKRGLMRKESQLSASSSQVMHVGAQVIFSEESMFAAKGSTAISARSKKVRRLRSRGSRGVSFSEIQDSPPGEIIEGEQELLGGTRPQPSETETTLQWVSHAPCAPAGMKRLGRRPCNFRQGNNTSFGSNPAREPGVLQEEEGRTMRAQRKANRRRALRKACRSLSFTSLPDVEAGEVLEESVPSLGKAQGLSIMTDVTPVHLGVDSKPRPRRSRLDSPRNKFPIDEPTSEVAADLDDDSTALQGKARAVQVKKKRRARVKSCNWSCSFSEVALDEAGEIPNDNAAAFKGVDLQHQNSQPGRATNLVRRRLPGGESNGHSVGCGIPQEKEDGEFGVTEFSKVVPAKRRRANVQRTRSVNTSMVVELQSGEIVERTDKINSQYTSDVSTHSVAVNARRTHRQDTPEKSQRLSRRACDISLTTGKRRQRLRTSKELSVSAIPDDLAGEIVEDTPDFLDPTTPVGDVFSNDALSRILRKPVGLFPLLNGNEGGSRRYVDPPISYQRSPTKSSQGPIVPKVDGSFIPEMISATLPPSSSAFC
ncbi:hypothetical protein JKF63_03192 [Porcisia hertigi]|uniref:Uncharacterized protein n=1 Tax=Porcisia hertigi TaxID=2761500 RepID=A0A836LAN2_9TRYP|nr:hypothetical protein JKF63_03192 [Porcisia hertigi]